MTGPGRGCEAGGRRPRPAGRTRTGPPGRPSRTRAGRIDDHGRTGLHRAALRPSRDLRQHPLGGRRRPPAA
ncbi:hypothetical protein DEJ21_05835 [Curtobacterium sp. MCSS17_006]|nr:hypothetical protein DEJ21_05835 [Curtobacterium sp. MCSS17_006]